jgi:hypothetical protein
MVNTKFKNINLNYSKEAGWRVSYRALKCHIRFLLTDTANYGFKGR